MDRDISSSEIRIRVRDALAVVAFLIGTAVAAAAGYYTLRDGIAEAIAEARKAHTKFDELAPRVERIECLIDQQTQFQIYGVVPSKQCEHPRLSR
jgi:uncharacterized protein YjaG (DUF416 family)